MPVSTIAELVQALTKQRWDDVLGNAEGSWVDFKMAPHNIGDERGKVTLASDVAAFANASGGVLLIGFETQKRPDVAQDVAVRHRPVAKPPPSRSIFSAGRNPRANDSKQVASMAAAHSRMRAGAYLAPHGCQ